MSDIIVVKAPDSAMHQVYSSAKTAINGGHNKLPAVYNKILWDKLFNYLVEETDRMPYVVDYGSGGDTVLTELFVNRRLFNYFPYDKYNKSTSVNQNALQVNPGVIICSNVLNVIMEDSIILAIHEWIRSKDCPFFITVYEKNKDCIGESTQKGNSYQRNRPLEDYLMRQDEIMYHGVITTPEYKRFIK